MGRESRNNPIAQAAKNKTIPPKPTKMCEPLCDPKTLIPFLLEGIESKNKRVEKHKAIIASEIDKINASDSLEEQFDKLNELMKRG